jgi:hexulose-6-phosphate isomerase
MSSLNRRQFLERSASVTLGAAALGRSISANEGSLPIGRAQPGSSGSLKKALCIGVLPKELGIMEKFKLAKATGFEGIEPNTIYKADELRQYQEAAQATGIKIHSIMNSDHWQYPLTDNDPAVVQKCIDGIKTSLQNAKELGAETILLVPGVVTADVRYVDAYTRSQKQIRDLLPLAAELRVIIAIENVGNRFLLSPLEFVKYIDEMNSPYLQGYFDIGNIARSGFPQDWIRTFGKRLVKVHIKAMEPGREAVKFDPKDRRTEGIDWIDVRKALSDVGYKGWITAEVRSGDETYLRELSARLDKFFAGESPV